MINFRNTIVVIILVYAALYVQYSDSQVVKENEDFKKRTTEIINYQRFQNSASAIFQREVLSTINQILELDDLTKDSKKVIKKKLCKLAVENSQDRLEVSDSYKCIAMIEKQNGDILASIKNISYANDLINKKAYSDEITSLVLGGGEAEAKITLKRSDFNSGLNIQDLEELTKSNDTGLAGRASYRLSLEYLLGRENADFEKRPDLEKATHMQKLAIEKLAIKEHKQTNVAFLFNDKYVKYAATTIASILLNSDLDNHYNFYVIYDLEDPISPDSMQLLAKLTKIRNCDIKFVPYPDELIKKHSLYFKGLESKIFPRLVAFQGVIENVLSNLGQVLIMDVDTLVLKDLHDLYSMDMGDHVIAASEDPGFEVLTRFDLCEGIPHQYFNAGVMLQNLKLMRENDNSTNLERAVQENRCNYRFSAQDPLNMIQNGKVLFLSSKWDMLPMVRSQFWYTYPNGFDPFIIHYAGDKPWGGKYMKKVENKEKVNEYVVLYYPYMEYAQSIILN